MALFLEIVAGPQAGSRYRLGEQPLLIGRLPGADIACPGDTFMSGRHCYLEVVPEGVSLKDLKSTNGTFFKDEPVTEIHLGVKDSFRAGSTLFVIGEENPQPASLPPPAGNAQSTILSHFALLSEPLYCLLDAACDPTISSLLQLTQERHESLYDGQSAINLARWAPYLVQLPPESPFTRALLDLGWGNSWASYFTSPAPFENLRHHFRKFLMVQIEGGKEVYFRFYDPRVLRDFLPTAITAELDVFYGPVTQWLIEGEDAQTMLIMKHREGLLAINVVMLAKK